MEADRLDGGRTDAPYQPYVKHDRSQVHITFNCGQAFSPTGSARPGCHCGLHAHSQLCSFIPIASGESHTEAAGSTLGLGRAMWAASIWQTSIASHPPHRRYGDLSPAAKTGQALLWHQPYVTASRLTRFRNPRPKPETEQPLTSGCSDALCSSLHFNSRRRCSVSDSQLMRL